MNIDPTYLDLSLEGVGVRNSQKRLKGLIADLAIQPLRRHQEALSQQFDLVEAIVMKRIAAVIVFWLQNKHDPIRAHIKNMMSDITNASKNDISLENFYVDEVKYAMYSLAPAFELEVPAQYAPNADELELALLELEESSPFDGRAVDVPYGDIAKQYEADYGYDDDDEEDDDSLYDYDDGYDDDDAADDYEAETADEAIVVERVSTRFEQDFASLTDIVREEPRRQVSNESKQAAIVSAPQSQVIEVEKPEIRIDRLDLTAEQAWQLIYGLIGYPSEYVQQTMLPRWQQNPDSFEKDRRFLYGIMIDTIRNSAGVQHLAGNYTFADGRNTVDQLWQHYFSDLARNISPQLAAAKLQTAANDPWYKKLWQRIQAELKNLSVIWLIALGIALVFDGLTTYVSLDQTPMEGPIVIVFTVLITALFQIADQLVISYRRREFDAEALAAKYRAQFERLSRTVESLEASSDSYVQFTMEKSKAQAHWKAAEDNRKMARRGRFWSARIADINVVVTAYGFAFLFLNAEEPMYALAQQIDYIFFKGLWENVDLWVFLMIGLAVTVSFVVNTAQRTEILGWSMREMRNEN